MSSSNGKKIFAGIDVGSLASKALILAGNEIAGYALIPSGVHSEQSGRDVLNKALINANLKFEDISYLVATGYGRISAPYANKTVTEISCHAKGANFLYPNVRTIVDMGGQDCKTIRIDKDGNVVDFAMNDKCAAGTGRFLEVMANVFKVPLQELGALSTQATELVPMSSTCTVFVESETISLVARGEKPANILGGIHHAIANRINGLFARVGIEPEVFFSGGVAKNIGMRKAIEKVLHTTLPEPTFDPQLTGALGAAVLARNFSEREAK
jgi:(R)-2-hydroxyacyl-CoA dehydratese activating ATPase